MTALLVNTYHACGFAVFFGVLLIACLSVVQTPVRSSKTYTNAERMAGIAVAAILIVIAWPVVLLALFINALGDGHV